MFAGGCEAMFHSPLTAACLHSIFSLVLSRPHTSISFLYLSKETLFFALHAAFCFSLMCAFDDEGFFALQLC